jgi:hypothetical protein
VAHQGKTEMRKNGAGLLLTEEEAGFPASSFLSGKKAARHLTSHWPNLDRVIKSGS